MSAGRILAAVALALLLAVGPRPARGGLEPVEFETRAQQERYQALLRELRCTVCQNESLAESKAELARDMRARIHRMILDGASDREIKDFLVSRYGDFVLYRPPFQPNTWILWLGPGLIVVVGGLVVAALLKRRAKALPDDLPGIEDDR
jgi:cytochrome c-type biogenesis protein CcmH